VPLKLLLDRLKNFICRVSPVLEHQIRVIAQDYAIVFIHMLTTTLTVNHALFALIPNLCIGSELLCLISRLLAHGLPARVIFRAILADLGGGWSERPRARLVLVINLDQVNTRYRCGTLNKLLSRARPARLELIIILFRRCGALFVSVDVRTYDGGLLDWRLATYGLL